MSLSARTALAAIAAAFALAFGAANAGEIKRPLGVVELFTSQGCSSCPPADAALAEFAARGDVIALAYHVDYWDYLGWRDTLASPANTERQKAYSRTLGSRTIYTPQAIINGRAHMSGAKKQSIAATMSKMAEGYEGMGVDVSADWSGESIVIDIGAGFTAHQKAQVVMVYFDAAKRVEIERGENHGKTLVYRNAVTSVQKVGMWHGRATKLEVPLGDAPASGGGGCAVLLQKVGKDGSPGAILGATLVPIPAS